MRALSERMARMGQRSVPENAETLALKTEAALKKEITDLRVLIMKHIHLPSMHLVIQPRIRNASRYESEGY